MITALALILPATALGLRCGAAMPAGQAPAATDTFKFTNKLIGASSPYLLEHAHNPVNWYPWGSEALEKARAENKPIFLSVGYSACHWCHVMAREDFENEEIAGILNRNFVAIKVDREQRPDIDAQYMLAVQMMTGSGGWPMSVFLTPDRKPFFGGTYFPPAEFKSLLEKLVEIYAKQPEAVRAQAEKVQTAILGATKSTPGGKLPPDVQAQAVASLQSRFDRAEGGFSRKPKFPEAPNLAYLLARARKTGDKSVLAMVTTTLDHMAAGGLYDQLGGGFHRYSTDAIWRVPHFEKMLYDQSQLVLVYLEAYRLTNNPRYKQIVEETLAFVSREMRDKEGGFTSTLDADSEGEEGKFYLWTPDQVAAVLGADAPIFQEIFGVTAAGDIERKSVLHTASTVERTAAAHRLVVTTLIRRVGEMRQKMMAARDLRVRPRTDDKVLASWNGLMIAAYARAAVVLADDRYRQVAIEAARFLTKSMIVDGQIRHCYRAGKAEVPGLLEDYAYCAYGLLELADATNDKSWQDRAQTLQAQMVARLADTKNGGFYATAEASQGELLTRMKEGEDNATPSANGIAALSLVRLSAVSGDPSWSGHALRTIQAFQASASRVPAAYPTLLTAYQDLGMTGTLPAPPAVVRLQAGQVTGKGRRVITVAVKVLVQPGWHINANKASAGALISTALTLASGSGEKLVNVEYPPGELTRFAFMPLPLAIYVGEIVLRATVMLPRKGVAAVRFRLNYQACDDHACQAPAVSEIVVRVPQ